MSTPPVLPPPFTAAQWANILGCVAFCGAVGFAEDEAVKADVNADGDRDGESKNSSAAHPIIINAFSAAADIRAALGQECYDHVVSLLKEWTKDGTERSRETNHEHR